MEIDCNKKFDENEEKLAKELLNVDKKQKDMVANTQDGDADPKTVAAAESTTVAKDSGGDGGSDAQAKFVSKADDSQDCDNNKIDKCIEEEKSQTDTSGSTENDEKDSGELLLVPMAESVESQDLEEECEKSSLLSPIKGSGGAQDVELISDTDYNEEEEDIDDGGEEDIIEEDEEDYENDTSSVPSELGNDRNVKSSKPSSDLDDDDNDNDESDDDEYSEEDEEDDDDDVVELVPDSSDEDDRRYARRNQDLSITDDDDDNDANQEYDDDDDLMNDVILSSRKMEPKKVDKEKGNIFPIPRKKEQKQFKKKLRWDHRTQLKKRSVKW